MLRANRWKNPKIRKQRRLKRRKPAFKRQKRIEIAKKLLGNRSIFNAATMKSRPRKTYILEKIR